MPSREDPAQRGRRRAIRLRLEMGRDLHDARRGAGLSQATAGRRATLSQSSVSRLERGARAGTIDELSVLAAVVGLDLVIRLYPGGAPLRDLAHVRLLARLQATLAKTTAHNSWQTEVPIPIPGDQRAIDAVLRVAGRSVGFELETRLLDGQAAARRASLKARDAGLAAMILVLADTRANRSAVAAAAPTLLAAFPARRREIVAALQVGSPPANGILVV